jgi:hypothetical protein
MAGEAKTSAIKTMETLRTHSMSLGNASTQRTDRGFNIRIHAQDSDRTRKSGKIC